MQCTQASARTISELQRLEIELGDAALGAVPVVGDIGQARAWREAVLGIAKRLVIDIAAHLAQPLGGFDCGIHVAAASIPL